MARFDSVPPARFDSGIKLDSDSGPVPGTNQKHTMSEPALKLALLNTAEIKNLAGSLATGLTGNPALVAAPKVTPVQLTGAADAVSQQEVKLKAAEDNVPSQRSILTVKIDALKALITMSAKDSTLEVGGDPVKMEMLNIPVKSAGSPAPPAPAGGPQNFSVTQGDHSGDADGHCNAMRGAKLYRTEHAAGATGPWTEGYEGSKSKFTISGLPPGAELWFRMAAFVGGAWTDWSDPARCRIV